MPVARRSGWKAASINAPYLVQGAGFTNSANESIRSESQSTPGIRLARSLPLTAFPELSIVQILPQTDGVVLVARPRSTVLLCPCFGYQTGRVHSHYVRLLADLPGRVGLSKSGLTRAGFDVRIRKFETGSLSNWLWHQLKALGFPAICFVRVMPTRSDENDAKGLAEMARMGWYPQAAVKGAENWKTRSGGSNQTDESAAGHRQPNARPV